MGFKKVIKRVTPNLTELIIKLHKSGAYPLLLTVYGYGETLVKDDVTSLNQMTLEVRLENWIVARCREQNPRPRRVAELNAMFRDIYTDRRFWRYLDNENRAYYEDALSLMWRYFFLNLCEAATVIKSGSGSIPFWLIYFKWIVKSSSYSLMRYALSKIYSLPFLERKSGSRSIRFWLIYFFKWIVKSSSYSVRFVGS